MTYTWTDNAMQGGTACDVDKVNDNLMYLKYDNVSPQDGKIPYSVNSAYRDASGYADFINKVSDTEVSFDIDDGTTYEPLVVSYPDGSVETTTSQSNIDSGMSSDDTYYFVKEKGSAITVTTATITESYAAPSSPSSGDYWLDISVRPYRPYKYDGADWVATQFVKIGEVTKTSGTLGTPISYALNGQTILSQTSISSGSGSYTFNHNIGCKILRPEGYFNNISGVANLTAGTSGYAIATTGGTGTSYKDSSVFIAVTETSFKLDVGSTALWCVNRSGDERFTGADVEIFARRAF